MVLKYCPYTFETTSVGGSDARVTAVSGQESANMKHKTPITFTAFRSATFMFRLSALLTVLQSLFRRLLRSPVLFSSKKPTSCASTESKRRRRTLEFRRAICTVKTLPRRPAKMPDASAAARSMLEYLRSSLGVAVDGHRVDGISGEVRHRSRRDGVQHEKQKRHGEKREIG